MAERPLGARSWMEAIGIPVAALAAGIALEALFPAVETPVVPFLVLIVIAIRYHNRLAWVAYAVTVAGYAAHAGWPIVHPRRVAEAFPDLLIVAAAGALVIYGQIRARRIERRLSARERGEAERFRRLLSSSPDGIWRVGADGTIVEANEPLAAMLGYEVREIVGTGLAPYFTEDGAGIAATAYLRCRDGVSTSFEVPMRRKDGTEAWTLCSTHPVVDANGAYVEGFAIFRDITERHRAEEEREQALSLLEATLESTADGLLVVDREGRIARFNERFASMWRLPADILSSGDDDRAIGYVLSQLADSDSFVAKVRKLYATPEASSFDTLQFKDGRVFERYSMPQRLEGEVVGRVWSFRDVTDRERAYEEQRLAMEREASIAQNLDAALFTFVLGEGGVIARHEYVSKGAESLYGVPRDEILTDPDFWIRRIHSEDVETVVRPAFARLKRLQPAVVEVRYQSSKGIHRWHRSHLFPRREADGEIHVDGIEADVTERVKLEEQLRHAQKMEAIGQLAGGVAHDFNNILTAVIGYSDLVRSRMAADDPNRRAVEEIRKGGERAAGLTRQLLAFGRRMPTQPRMVEVNESIRDLQPMLQRLVGEDVTFTLELEPGVGKVRIDPTQWEQVLLNLAVNARDALPEGGAIGIRTERFRRDSAGDGEPPAGAYVRVRFRDDGSGIPHDVLDHIFEPFFTTKDPGRGTGLGLAMVYGIVRQHGGTIEVRSEVGAGTDFEIVLPEAEGEDRAVPLPADFDMRGQERILLVEDDAALLVLGREVLTELGYEVTAARSGAEALRALDALEAAATPPDLLVTDLIMPEIGGRELARAAWERRPGLRVLFVSGYAGDVRPEAEAGGPIAPLLEKPFTPLALARKVREVLETASRGRAGAPIGG